jgi:superfamily II DNA helicase RecQ
LLCTANRILAKNYYAYVGFRSWQKEAVNAMLQEANTIVAQATGTAEPALPVSTVNN